MTFLEKRLYLTRQWPKLANFCTFHEIFYVPNCADFSSKCLNYYTSRFLCFFVNQDERNLPFPNDVRERFPPLATQPDFLNSVFPTFAKTSSCKNHRNYLVILEIKK